MRFAVIGASRGLGLCLTRRLLETGHTVAAVTRAPCEAMETLSERHGGRLMPLLADITREEQMSAAAGQAAALLGELDAVCVSAGVLLDGDRVNLLHNCDIAELRRTLDVNVVGPVIAARAFAPRLRAGGRMFIVTSEGVGVPSCGTWASPRPRRPRPAASSTPRSRAWISSPCTPAA